MRFIWRFRETKLTVFPGVSHEVLNVYKDAKVYCHPHCTEYLQRWPLEDWKMTKMSQERKKHQQCSERRPDRKVLVGRLIPQSMQWSTINKKQQWLNNPLFLKIVKTLRIFDRLLLIFATKIVLWTPAHWSDKIVTPSYQRHGWPPPQVFSSFFGIQMACKTCFTWGYALRAAK